MLINTDCSGCGLCVSECPLKAIHAGDGAYRIDSSLCNRCENLMDQECVRICPVNAITEDDGRPIPFDPTWRMRPEHLIWLMALMASRGAHDDQKYIVNHPQWDMKRKIVAAAMLNPELTIRFTRSFDEICIQCGAKQEIGHPEVSGEVDDRCFAALQVKPGETMRFWDAIKRIEANWTQAFVKSLTPIPDDIYQDFLNFLPRDAKAFRE
jgi:ferredoxin